MSTAAGDAAEPPQGQASLLRSSAVMTVGTLLSRITGYARSFLLVAAIGLALHADLFTVANTVPNALYILVAGGVLNAVLVPQLVRSMRHDADGGTAYANRVITLVALVLVVATTLAVVFAPALMRLYAPGQLYDPELAAARQSLETFARLCLPQIFFYGMFVLVGQVLNARGRFGPMMFTPIANNVVACAVLGAYLVMYEPAGETAGYTRDQELLLGVGSTVGVAIQAILLVPYLRAVGLRYRPRFDFRGTGLRHTGRLALWTVLFVMVNQVAYLVVTRLAVEGSATAGLAGDSPSVGATVYQNAYLLMMLPHALVTVSLATALLPRLSAQAASGRIDDLRRELLSTMRLAVAAAVAAGFVLLAIALPLTRLLFGWGAGAGETRSLGITVMFFVPGLIAFTVHFVTLRGFYAIEDTKTPFLVQCVIGAINIAAAVIISAAVGQPSAMVLAASFSIAYCVGALVSTAALARRLDGLDRSDLAWSLLRSSGAAVPAAVAAYVGAELGAAIGEAVEDSSGGALAALLAVGIGGTLALPTYLVAARRLRVTEVAQVVDLLTSRLRRGRRNGAGATPPPTMESVYDNEDTVIGLPPLADGAGDDAPEEAANATATAQAYGVQAAAGVTGAAGRVDGRVADAPPAASDRPPPAGDPRGGRTAVPTPALEPGAMIAGRYRLEELLAVTDGAATWRGIDEVLSRPVALHLLSRDDPRASGLADAARSAAGVADPHFLRVLDVSADDEHVYIVREWVSGRNLAQALVNGPFAADDATYVVRELAAALANAHRAGLSHLRIEPDTVVLADNGQVKIVDVGVDRVLYGTSADDEARADAEGIGRVLYALLTGRWPGRAALGMPAAPTQDGRLCSPRQVLAGVPGPLDEVADRILGDPPRGSRPPLHSPAEIEEALDYVAGRPVRRRPISAPVPAPVHVERAADVESTQTWHRPDQPPEPVPAPPRQRGNGRKVLGGLLALLLVAALVVVGWQLVQQLNGDDGSPPETSASPTATTPTVGPVAAVEATAYDPVYDPSQEGLESGDGTENDSLAGDAIDGDPTTAWTTSNYFDPLELQKPGVGLLVDLGAVHTVSGAELTLLAAGGTVELRAAPEDATEPPATPDDFTVLATTENPPVDVTLTATTPVRTRFVLVWFTVLPQYAEGYRNGVAEAVVLGE